MKNNRRTALVLLAAVLFIISAVMAVDHMAGYRTSQESIDRAQEAAAVSPTPEPVEIAEPEIPLAPTPSPEPTPEPVEPLAEDVQYLLSLDLASLREVNPDVLGWIVIPGTVVDYPLMEGEDNNEYLTTTWDGKRANAGSIFKECKSSRDFVDFNTIIYGHNMKGGSMFATLKKYADQSFWSAHPTVYIVTDLGVSRYEIFASFEAEIIGPAYWLGSPQESTRQSFVDYSLGRSVIDTGIVPTTDDKVVTLSTCTGDGTYDTRWVAQAVLTGRFPLQSSEAPEAEH